MPEPESFAELVRRVRTGDPVAAAELVRRYEPAMVTAIEYSPDGRWIAAYSGMDSAIRVVDAETGRQDIVLRGYPSVVRSMAFHPDSRKLIAGYKDGRVVVWGLDAGPAR
jgi:WD40 repeat protein